MEDLFLIIVSFFLGHVKEIYKCERKWYADTGKSKAGEKERQGKDAVRCMQLTR